MRKSRFFWERFPAKITTQVSRQEESGSISPNDATVELYEGERHLDQHYLASKFEVKSWEDLGSVVIRI